MDPYNNFADFVKLTLREPTSYQRGFMMIFDKYCAVTPDMWGVKTLAPLPQQVPQPECAKKLCKQEQGNKPMRYNETTTQLNINAAPCETQTQREYLLDRLQSARLEKRSKVRGIFNIDVDNSPETFVDLIERIKKGKYTIDSKIESKIKSLGDDEKRFNGPLYGIIWEGPQPDHKGFDQAIQNDIPAEYVKAKDIIMVADPVKGLEALRAFEAWMPSK